MSVRTIGPATLYFGDCLDVLRDMPDNSVDAIVTDPPYGLKFMGRKWDYDVPNVEIWAECLRVAKPGAHLLSFAGTRTQHRMACRIEDAGWEIRDMIAWHYGSGFPKSMDISKAIDKVAGAEREVIGKNQYASRRPRVDYEHAQEWGSTLGGSESANITAPATPAAAQWSGWGTAIKPAMEPITMARKPLDGTVAANVLAHGTGALNIDGCRVGHDEECRMMAPSQANIENPSEKHRQAGRRKAVLELKPSGRWPANVIHDGSEEVLDLLGESARFYYCPKASKKDRDGGLENYEHMSAAERVNRKEGSAGMESPRAGAGRTAAGGNHHPTVKPTDLMRYLCRLVTPPGGIVLDPFMGSGSTGKAAKMEGFQFIGIDREAEYLEIASRRIEAAHAQGDLFTDQPAPEQPGLPMGDVA